MRIATMASTVAIALGIALAIAPACAPAGGARPARATTVAVNQPTARSPLGSYPAEIRYLSNDAPFVVFDVWPRSLGVTPGDADAVTLSFVATDTLRLVNVFAYARAGPSGTTQMAAGVPCGPRDAGSWECRVPARALLDRLDPGDGEFGLRIEADGPANQHSTVLVTLPLKTAARPAQ
ncbi:hypothetical protein [Variovorax ginsengisoli]|uniref:Lipoprotein n=1 Tax=Variovorax ginsengisoli TaxID=363844 RepID=A0ABT8SGG7_9BURK|nr:hypothetical protein [Variovorax ginsengisoli]MDN8618844.1 hypothetical protein [Variovorax ginsengisoli]MDO1538014.1 hypothetical protein [Variovorax ginsengisoli]